MMPLNNFDLFTTTRQSNSPKQGQSDLEQQDNREESLESSQDSLEAADCILGERVRSGKKQFLIRWLGNQPDGSAWEDSWGEDPTEELIEAWKAGNVAKEAKRKKSRKATQTKTEKDKRHKDRQEEFVRQEDDLERAERFQKRQKAEGRGSSISKRIGETWSRHPAVNGIRSSPHSVDYAVFKAQSRPRRPQRHWRAVDSNEITGKEVSPNLAARPGQAQKLATTIDSAPSVAPAGPTIEDTQLFDQLPAVGARLQAVAILQDPNIDLVGYLHVSQSQALISPRPADEEGYFDPKVGGSPEIYVTSPPRPVLTSILHGKTVIPDSQSQTTGDTSASSNVTQLQQTIEQSSQSTKEIKLPHKAASVSTQPSAFDAVSAGLVAETLVQIQAVRVRSTSSQESSSTPTQDHSTLQVTNQRSGDISQDRQRNPSAAPTSDTPQVQQADLHLDPSNWQRRSALSHSQQDTPSAELLGRTHFEEIHQAQTSRQITGLKAGSNGLLLTSAQQDEPSVGGSQEDYSGFESQVAFIPTPHTSILVPVLSPDPHRPVNRLPKDTFEQSTEDSQSQRIGPQKASQQSQSTDICGSQPRDRSDGLSFEHTPQSARKGHAVSSAQQSPVELTAGEAGDEPCINSNGVFETMTTDLPSSVQQPPSQLPRTLADSAVPQRPQSPSRISPPPLGRMGTDTLSEAIQPPKLTFAERRAAHLPAQEETRKTMTPTPELPTVSGFNLISVTDLIKESTPSITESLPDASMKIKGSAADSMSGISHMGATPSFQSRLQLGTKQASQPYQVVAVAEQSSKETPPLNFFVPISITEHQYQIYGDMILWREYSELIQSFVDRSGASQEISAQDLTERVQGLVEKLREITVHTDLVSNDSLTQDEIASQKQADWDVTSSTKFAFLKEVTDTVIGSSKHIVILSKGDRTNDRLESFLRGLRVSYSRPDEHSSYTGRRGPLHVTILRTGGNQVAHRADLVIGIDSTFHLNDAQVVQVRQQALDDGHLCPAICLVVPNTVEHIERHLPAGLSMIERLRLLVLQMTKLKDKAGTDAADASRLAQEIGQYLLGQSAKLELPILDKILFSQAEAESQSADSDLSMLDIELNTIKRRRSDDGTQDQFREAAKKPRFTTQLPSGEASSTASNLDFVASPVNLTIGAQEVGREDMHQDQTTKLARVTWEAALQKRYDSLVIHYAALEKAMGTLQTRSDNELRDFRVARNKAKADLAGAEAAKESSERRRDAAVEFVGKLKAERSTLQADLELARTELLGSSLPQVCELEELRVNARRVDALEEKLVKSKQEHEASSEYVRSLYQDASNKAVAHRATIDQLEIENEELKAKASGEVFKLNELFRSHSIQLAHAEIDKLKRERNAMAEQLRRITEENRKLKEDLQKRAGMTLMTRAASLPPKGIDRASHTLEKRLTTGAGSGAASQVATSSARNHLPSALSKAPVSAASSRGVSRQVSPAKGVQEMAPLQERLGRSLKK